MGAAIRRDVDRGRWPLLQGRGVKILHVETGRHFLGGPQQVVYLVNALQGRGYDNILVCPPDSAIDPIASMQAVDNPSLGEVAEQVRVKLQKVIENL